jgi:prolipoprotein diacylglyceryltransferase
MRIQLVRWLANHDLPGWLAPGWTTMVALAGILGVHLFLRLAAADRADARLELRAIALGYVAALAGGQLIEALRALPVALATGSWSRPFVAGRAAYGGLIAGVAVAAWVVRRGGGKPLAFLDRLTVLLGASFACVRTGCFFAGCDFGQPTAGALGLRFPSGSHAAIDHAMRGWVAPGSASLPVHATQLYEAALGVAASALAFVWLRRGRRDGAAVATWLGAYAVGRFGIELFRGDPGRGFYAGVSSAQIVSLCILAALVAWLLSRRARSRAAIAVAVAIVCMSLRAEAQPSEPPPSEAPPSEAQPSEAQPPPPPPRRPAPVQMRVLYETPAPEWDAPKPDGEDVQESANRERLVGLRAWSGVALPFRFQLAPYLDVGGDVYFRIPVSARHRFEIGASVGGAFGDVATHVDVGLPLSFVMGVAEHLELGFTLRPRYLRVLFASPHFEGTNAFGGSVEMSLQFPITTFFDMGFTPANVTVVGSGTVSSLVMWEPRFWFGFAL